MFVFLAILSFLALTQGRQVCYTPYGCFTDNPPFNEPLVQLPEDPAKLNTVFSLYTKQSQGAEIVDPLDVATVKKSHFNGTKRTVVALHGYLGNSGEVWVEPLIKALLEHEDMNVIFVDWKEGANFPYHQAVGDTRVVGAQITKMVQTLMEHTPTFDLLKFHCIGFSLGSHVCGYVGRNFKRLQKTIGRITALDPVGLYFDRKHVDARLDKDDAAFVDVIHTDTKRLFGVLKDWVGTATPLGHLDFYPNGGYAQPGCRVLDKGVYEYFTCSHHRAAVYFTESINQQHCPQRAYPCDNYDDFANALCSECTLPDCPRMGYHSVDAPRNITGKYYLQTYDKQPFCAYHYNIEFNTQSGYFDDLSAKVYVTMTGKDDISEQITIPSHYYKSGSKVQFLIRTRKNLGKLLKVQVSHAAWIDRWGLESVVVRPMWTKNAYTACFQRTLNNNDNEVNFHTDQPAYCNPVTL